MHEIFDEAIALYPAGSDRSPERDRYANESDHCYEMSLVCFLDPIQLSRGLLMP